MMVMFVLKARKKVLIGRGAGALYRCRPDDGFGLLV